MKTVAPGWVVEPVVALDDLDADVRNAFRHHPGRDFFASLEWFECLARHGFAATPDERVFVVRRPDGEPGAAFFGRADGRHLATLGNFYSTRFDLALADGTDAAPACDALARGLRATRPRWTSIELRGLRADRPVTTRLAAALAAAGYAVDVFFQYENRFAAVTPGDFAAYLAARPSRLRHTLDRRRRRAERRGLEFELVTRPGDALARGIAAYERVYAASWKRAEPVPAFMPALVRLACRLGLGRLGVAGLAGEPAAVQFWIVSAGQALVYKLAHDPRFEDCSPGTLLTAEMIRRAIDEDGVTELDFGIGSEPYKLDWVDRSRDVVGIEALEPSTLAGQAGRLRRAVRDALRRAGLRRYRPVVLEDVGTAGSIP